VNKPADFEVKKADLKTLVWAIWMALEIKFRGWVYFLSNFILDIAGMIVDIFVFFFLALFVGSAFSPYIARYGGNYMAYVIIGMALNNLLGASLNSFYSSYHRGYWTAYFDIYITSPLGIKAYMVGDLLYSYFITGIDILFYMLIGFFTFNLVVAGNIGTAALTIILGMIATIGMGLVAASTFTLLNAKQWPNPVSWVVNFLVGLVSGVYFPLEVLPEWARAIGYLLPQTYAYDATRMALLSGASVTNPLVASDLSLLILSSFITIPIGIFLFKRSLSKAEKDGTLSRWS